MSETNTELRVLEEEQGEVEKILSEIDTQVESLTTQKQRMTVLLGAFRKQIKSLRGETSNQKDLDLEGEQDPNSE
tara:strand:+ start:660 stop:884 length:225 start_codon:yes stop_codon:yes gene_type:complete